jgi:hypothetical protein
LRRPDWEIRCQESRGTTSCSKDLEQINKQNWSNVR